MKFFMAGSCPYVLVQRWYIQIGHSMKTYQKQVFATVHREMTFVNIPSALLFCLTFDCFEYEPIHRGTRVED
jgi:hypothetical protein